MFAGFSCASALAVEVDVDLYRMSNAQPLDRSCELIGSGIDQVDQEPPLSSGRWQQRPDVAARHGVEVVLFMYVNHRTLR